MPLKTSNSWSSMEPSSTSLTGSGVSCTWWRQQTCHSKSSHHWSAGCRLYCRHEIHSCLTYVFLSYPPSAGISSTRLTRSWCNGLAASMDHKTPSGTYFSRPSKVGYRKSRTSESATTNQRTRLLNLRIVIRMLVVGLHTRRKGKPKESTKQNQTLLLVQVLQRGIRALIHGSENASTRRRNLQGIPQDLQGIHTKGLFNKDLLIRNTDELFLFHLCSWTDPCHQH